jgi:hypothetical protein
MGTENQQPELTHEAVTESHASAKPKQREKRTRHGLRAVMARVKVSGLSRIDQRSVAAQQLVRWKTELIRDLGGDLSAQKLALVELATRSKLFIDHIDAWLLTQPTLIRKRSRSVLPALRERQALCDGLLRQLAALGLNRVPAPVKALHEYIQDREKGADDVAPSTEPSAESWQNNQHEAEAQNS